MLRGPSKAGQRGGALLLLESTYKQVLAVLLCMCCATFYRAMLVQKASKKEGRASYRPEVGRRLCCL